MHKILIFSTKNIVTVASNIFICKYFCGQSFKLFRLLKCISKFSEKTENPQKLHINFIENIVWKVILKTILFDVKLKFVHKTFHILTRLAIHFSVYSSIQIFLSIFFRFATSYHFKLRRTQILHAYYFEILIQGPCKRMPPKFARGFNKRRVKSHKVSLEWYIKEGLWHGTNWYLTLSR